MLPIVNNTEAGLPMNRLSTSALDRDDRIWEEPLASVHHPGVSPRPGKPGRGLLRSGFGESALSASLVRKIQGPPPCPEASVLFGAGRGEEGDDRPSHLRGKALDDESSTTDGLPTGLSSTTQDRRDQDPPDSRSLAIPFGFAGRDELNLAEFPITLLADRAPEGQKTLVFQDKIYDEGEGKVISRKVTVTASDRFGLPTPKDDDVILGLIQLTKETNGFTNRTVRFNRADLVRLLGWSDSGQSYQRIDQSLHRWLGVTLIYENAWWDRQQRAWTTRGFHMIDGFELNDARGPDGKHGDSTSRFTWNDVIFQSFQVGYMKRLELGIYLKLRLPTSKRIYRFLDKRFFHKRTWEFDLREFAIEHIGLSRSYSDNGKLKEKLKPAIDELTELGFLDPMPAKDRYVKVGRSRWKIKFVRRADPFGDPKAVEMTSGLGDAKAASKVEAGPTSKRERAASGSSKDRETSSKSSVQKPESNPPAFSTLVLQDPERSGLCSQLVERGVTPAIAVELARQFPVDLVREQIEAFDWLVKRGDKKLSRNPAGYLVKAIQDGYEVPKGFESTRVREAKHQKKATELAEQEAVWRRRRGQRMPRNRLVSRGSSGSGRRSPQPNRQRSRAVRSRTRTRSSANGSRLSSTAWAWAESTTARSSSTPSSRSCSTTSPLPRARVRGEQRFPCRRRSGFASDRKSLLCIDLRRVPGGFGTVSLRDRSP